MYRRARSLPERCGCTPNGTTCADKTLAVCNSDGKSETTTAGASGGLAQVATFEPLGGGCDGGPSDSTGGGGGGAIQWVSLSSFVVTRSGAVNVGGGGGADHGGGGAGGTVLAEAPLVSLLGKVTANGAAGGACGKSGPHATPDGIAAPGVGGCSGTMTLSGAGGTGSSAPTDGFASPADPGAGVGEPQVDWEFTAATAPTNTMRSRC